MELQDRLIMYRNDRAAELDDLKQQQFLKEVENSDKEESERSDTKELERRISELTAVVKSFDDVLNGSN